MVVDPEIVLILTKIHMAVLFEVEDGFPKCSPQMSGSRMYLLLYHYPNLNMGPMLLTTFLQLTLKLLIG